MRPLSKTCRSVTHGIDSEQPLARPPGRWNAAHMGVLHIDRICPRAFALCEVGAGTVLETCRVAGTPLARLVGLLATPVLRPGEGILITPCSSVHTVGMRRAISCAFLDADGRVLRVVDPLPPRRMIREPGAAAVVEAAPGVLGHLVHGRRLLLATETAG